jgi:N-acetylglutamate synthase-like GNAT family acetyltransferase
MSVINHQVRRATVDDLAALRLLWRKAELSVPDLEKRFQEFQVVETADGAVLGALGMQTDGHHARLHSECYQSSEMAEDLRARLWDRVLTVSRNHGWTRLWIEKSTSIFWLEQEFEVASKDVLATLPASFGKVPVSSPWLTLKLRDEVPAARTLEHELELFRNSQQAQSDRLTQQTRLLRLFATVVVVGLLVLIAFAAWYVLRGLHRPVRH